MQIIFFLLFSSLAFAQKNSPGIQCDPKELENQCYNLLCDNSPPQILVSDSEEVIAKALAQPFTKNEQLTNHLNSLATTSESIKASLQKKLGQEEINKMASDLIQDPFKSLTYLKNLFSSDMSCVMENGKCDLVVNDLVTYPEGMKNLFQKLSEETILFDSDSAIPLKEKKEKMIAALERLSGTLTKDEIKREKRNIEKLRTEGEFMVYSLTSSWSDKYTSLVVSEITPLKNDLATSLKMKMEEMLTIDFKSEESRNKVTRSCQVANYIHNMIQANASQGKLDEEVEKVLETFKTKFLAKLSVSTAAEISAKINKYSFNLIYSNGSIYPGSPMLGRHYMGHSEPKNTFEVLQDLNVLRFGENYGCRVTSNTVGDHYNPNNESIFVSAFVLANKLSDVLTHELGHWFSHQHQDKKLSSHSSRKIKDVRKCVKSFYPRERSRGVYRGDHSRTEEDFADWFAAKAGIGTQRMWCDLKKVLKSTPGSDFLPEDGDTHSNILFREMVMRLNRGEGLPQPCKDLIELNPELEPRNCEM